MTDNPYPTETETNTGSTAWLDGYKTIKADFTTLHGYAQNMLNASMAMMSSAGAVNQIPKFAQDGFAGKPQNAPSGMDGFAGSFPEAQLVQHINNTNFFDFVSMLHDVTMGLQNVAFAAQTVCDAYHLNDTSSAKDLNSLITVDGVDFAFGRGGARPKGLASRIGKTVLDQQFEDAQKNAGNQADGNMANLMSGDPSAMNGTIDTQFSYLPMGQSVQTTTITYPDGSKVVQSTYKYPDGRTVENFTTFNGKGQQQSTAQRTSTRTDSGTTVVTSATDAQGHKSGSTTTTSSRTDFPGPEEPVSTTTKDTTNSDGSHSTTTTTSTQGGPTTTTTTTTDAKGHTKSGTVAVGNNDADVSDQNYDPHEDNNSTYRPDNKAPAMQ